MSVKRNSVYNVIGSLLPIAIVIYTTPLYIHRIGMERFGFLSVFWIAIGYLGFLDLGLSRSVNYRLSRSFDVDKVNAAKDFWTALTWSMFIGIIGGLFVLLAASIYFNLLTADLESKQVNNIELLYSIPWIAAIFPLLNATAVINSALQGVQKFLHVNFLTVLSSALFQLVPLWTAFHIGIRLDYLVASVFFVRLGVFLVYFECARRYIFKEEWWQFDRHRSKGLFSFGFWVFIGTLIESSMVVLDRLFISAALGAKSVAYYSIPFQLGDRSLVLSRAISLASFPKISKSAKNEQLEIQLKIMLVMAILLTPPTLFLIVFMQSILSVWISPDFSEKSTLTAQILFFAFWVNSFTLSLNSFAVATERARYVALLNACQIVPYFICMYFLANFFGVAGVAFVFLVKIIIDLVFYIKLAGFKYSTLLIQVFPAAFMGLSLLCVSGFDTSFDVRFFCVSALIAFWLVVGFFVFRSRQFHFDFFYNT